MMIAQCKGIEVAQGANILVRDHFCVKPGEELVITADPATDMAAVEAIMSAAAVAGAKPMLLLIPQLPFQGTLADPFIPEALAQAVINCDVWFDMTFPYLAGSHVHDRAMKANRARYLLVGDLKASGLQRLYGAVGLDRLFEVQKGFDRFMASGTGAKCRITSPAGTDISFTLGKSVTEKLRRTERPGTFTIMGAGIYFPEPDSVQGDIFLDAIFHEYYVTTPKPIHLVVDGQIREIRHDGGQAQATERALRRAGGGNYGRVIHLTYGFHPTARFDGESFIENIRSVGSNAVGLGTPWWEPGGGENHPDGVIASQSLWVDGEQIVSDGVIISPPELAQMAKSLQFPDS